MRHIASIVHPVCARDHITLYQAVGESALRNMHRYHNVELQVAMPEHTHALLKCRYAAARRSAWRLARATGERIAIVRHQLHRMGLQGLTCETVAYEEEREYCVAGAHLDRLSAAVLVPSYVLDTLKRLDETAAITSAGIHNQPTDGLPERMESPLNSRSDRVVEISHPRKIPGHASVA